MRMRLEWPGRIVSANCFFMTAHSNEAYLHLVNSYRIWRVDHPLVHIAIFPYSVLDIWLHRVLLARPARQTRARVALK
jgi:hypothetical protein